MDVHVEPCAVDLPSHASTLELEDDSLLYLADVAVTHDDLVMAECAVLPEGVIGPYRRPRGSSRKKKEADGREFGTSADDVMAWPEEATEAADRGARGRRGKRNKSNVARDADDDELASPTIKKSKRPSSEEKTKGGTRMTSATSDDELAEDGTEGNTDETEEKKGSRGIRRRNIKDIMVHN